MGVKGGERKAPRGKGASGIKTPRGKNWGGGKNYGEEKKGGTFHEISCWKGEETACSFTSTKAWREGGTGGVMKKKEKKGRNVFGKGGWPKEAEGGAG